MLYALPLLAYFIGSISSAVIVARLFGLQDPRTVGSRNPGATNVLRYGGKKAAALTLAGDLLKGVAAVVLARLLTDDAVIIALAALGAFLGHLYPVFFGFKGGKGVATALGVFAAMNIWVGAALAATWLLLAAVSRYSSLSAIIAALLAPLYVWLFLPAPPYLIATVVMVAVLLWRHRGNIRNLVSGSETKIGR